MENSILQKDRRFADNTSNPNPSNSVASAKNFDKVLSVIMGK